MAQSSVLSFDPSHVRLTHYLIAIWDVVWIHFEPISHVEKTLPQTRDRPQWFKGFGAMVSDSPTQDAWFEVVYDGPNPDFIFFYSLQTFVVHPVHPLAVSLLGHRHPVKALLFA